MKDKEKKTSPSRLRYEKSHPTVSFRVSKEIYDELEIMMKNEGKSLTDVLKIGLGRLEVKATEEDDIRNEGIVEGYVAGGAEAEEMFKVEYPCNVCGAMIKVSNVDEKEAIMQYMMEHGWGHNSCHKKH